MQYTVSPCGQSGTCQLRLVDLDGEHHFSSGDIIRLEANNSYTVVYFDGRRPFVVSKVLKTYEELLAPYGFVRTHRSHLVNKRYVDRIERSRVIMRDTSIVGLRRKEKANIIGRLKHQ